MPVLTDIVQFKPDTRMSLGIQAIFTNEIKSIISLAVNGLSDVDKTVHLIRKSLKNIVAILVLTKDIIDNTQYSEIRSFFKSFSKKLTNVRESYINLKTFTSLDPVKSFPTETDPAPLKEKLNLEYEKARLEAINIFSEITQSRTSFEQKSKIMESILMNIDYKLLKNRYLKLFKKTRNFYNKLTLSSSMFDYHKLRKLSNILYFQQFVLNTLKLIRSHKKRRKLHKLISDSGFEHDLQLFGQYIERHFNVLHEKIAPYLNKMSVSNRKSILINASEIFC
jgi:hypothetical protein